MLKAVGLSKRYGGRAVIDDWSCAWSEPGVHRIAGANGAGKSTLLAMLSGALAPDAGEVSVGGEALKTSRSGALRGLSYCPADCPVFPFLSGREWLAFVRSVRGGWNGGLMDELIAAFGLPAYLDTKFDRLSLGTARKFMLVATLAADAEVYILDEPTNALDDASLEALQATVRTLARTRLIVLSCHEASQHAALGITAEKTVTLS
ncbi:ABC transporter ATP-binding protein [Methylococcus sp. EFPC2]|uniref:ABC transporter ATP-binding protein n=1 Tax=Methylococcus sp. EFPC2 TaxID=2812648 RepID=UPI00196768FB|nr:ABC transporter ATP-binding protein [Methylococcus sp. EFPC2]QSA98276.1 ABC transporter ATP-binding protein [Methylococcus sp. EFPC2]